MSTLPDCDVNAESPGMYASIKVRTWKGVCDAMHKVLALPDCDVNAESTGVSSKSTLSLAAELHSRHRGAG